MAMKHFIFLLFIPFFFACSSGYRQLNKGQYYEAAQTAIKRLRKDPDHGKSAHVLEKAYAMSVKNGRIRVERLVAATTPFRYDQVVAELEKLNFLRNEIENCPACLQLIPNPLSFDNDLENARQMAAEEHFNEGLRLMKGDMVQARQAHYHFNKAQQYQPNLEHIDEWLAEALEKATLRVLIQPIPMHSAMYDLTNAFFEQQIIEYARGLNFQFVHFMSVIEVQETQIVPHQEIYMRFDDFVVGQMLLKESSKELKKDSVKVGNVSLENGKTAPVYGTVKADFVEYSKSVKSSGLLDFRIIDHETGAIIRQQKFPGTHVWQYQWAAFNGDERALSKEQLELSRKREVQPPLPQNLFIEFTRPIYGQLTGAIRRHYQPWR